MNETDNQLDDVWAAMLDEPAPPLPTAQRTLAVARSSSRRRGVWAVAASGLAGVLVIGSVTAGVTYVGAGANPPTAPDPVALAPAPPRQQPPPPLLAAPADWKVTHAHGAQAAAILLAAVPAGYTGLLEQLSTNGPAATWILDDTPQYNSTIYVIITTGQADGMLTLSIVGGIASLGDDICSAAATAYLTSMWPDYPATCDIITVNGVPIRISSAHDQEHGDVIRATRLLDGGLLTVEAEQGIPVHRSDDSPPPDAPPVSPPRDGHSILGGWPALPAVPLTSAQLAAVAANPAVVP